MPTITAPVPLSHRAVLQVGGAGAAVFLQGLLTNDSTLPGLSSTAHLTPQGRLVAEALLQPHPQQQGVFWLDVARTHLLPLAKSLHRYDVARQIAFDDLSDDISITAVAAGTPGALPDPRHPALPWRLYENKAAPATAPEPLPYRAARLSLGVPDAAIDTLPKPFLPAELGLEHLNAVSFTKGCYVGQEVTARLHHKSRPSHRLFMAALTIPTQAPVGTPLRYEGKPHGHLLSHHGKTALVMLPASTNLTITVDLSNDTFLTDLQSPPWWPSPLAQSA